MDDIDTIPPWTDDMEHLARNVAINSGCARTFIYKVAEFHAPPSSSPAIGIFVDDAERAPAGPAIFGRSIREWVKRRAELVLICGIPAPIAAMIALGAAVHDINFDAAIILTRQPRRRAWMAAFSTSPTRL